MRLYRLLFFTSIFVAHFVHSQNAEDYSTKFDSLIKWHNTTQASELIKQLEVKFNQPKDLNQINLFKGILLKETNQLDESLIIFQKAYEFYLTINDTNKIFVCINNIGNVLRRAENYDEALNWYQKGLKSTLKIPQLLILKKNISLVYNYQSQFEKSINSLKEILSIKHKHKLPIDGSIQYQIGTTLYLQGNKKDAIIAYKNSMKFRDSSTLIYPINELALSYLEIGNILVCKKYLDIAEKLPKNLDSEIRFYDILTEYFKTTHQFKYAFGSKEKYLALYKKKINTQRINTIEELNAKFQKRLNESQIKLQSKQIQLGKEESKSRLYIIISIVIFSLLLFLSFIFLWNLRQKKFTTEKLQATIHSENFVKKEISMNLHDHVVSDLVALRYNLENLQMSEKITPEELDKNILLLNENTVKLRQISHQLYPSFKADKLSNLILSEIDKIGTNSRIQICFVNDVENEVICSIEMSREIIAILKEIISNTLKYSNGNNLKINLSGKESNLIFNILDNGNNFNANSTSGLGLISIKNRLKKLNSTLNLSFENKNIQYNFNINHE